MKAAVRRASALALACAFIASAHAQLGHPVTSADYARAEQLLPQNTDHLVLHAVDKVAWLPSGRFWYRTRTEQGLRAFIVDPARGTRQLAFEQERILLSLRHAQAKGSAPADLPIDGFELSSDEKGVTAQVGGRRWTCDTEGRRCSPSPSAGPNVVLAPDKSKAVFVRDFNLWLLDLATGSEVPLTTDGTQDFAYARDNVGTRRTDIPVVLWSPDSRRVATFQQDVRGVGEMFLVQPTAGHPRLDAWKYPMAGDAAIPTIHRVVVDTQTRTVVRLKMPPDFSRSAAWLGVAHLVTRELEAQWSSDGAALAFISVSRDHKCAQLRVADAGSGLVRDVLKECSRTFFESAPSGLHAARVGGENWRYLSGTNEIIWYSMRDNWGHLYLYDLGTGRLKQQLTSGEWNVGNVLSVDTRERTLYFTAVGREPGRNPYFEHMYRVAMDGSGLTLLTPEDAAHVISMSPGGRHFVDTYSRPDTAPVTVLRSGNGKLLRVLERADVSRLLAIGWKPPVVITVKARDGITDLYGLMLEPTHLDEGRKYPIVNAIYSSPSHGSVLPTWYRSQWGVFSTAYGGLADAQSLAELGFVVVMIDGLGTPLLSRTFHETNYGRFGDATLPDQIAGMRQLAQRYRWIDIDRAGIYGFSHGGYAAARAMFVYPDFFKVAVAISGGHDRQSYADEEVEKYMGLIEREPDGSSNYARQSNLEVAKNLRGHLLLVHGMADDNVLPYHTLLLSQKLIEANKDFDLLLLPTQAHGVMIGQPGQYLIRREWDYFVRHLLGTTPPREYQLHAPGE